MVLKTLLTSKLSNLLPSDRITISINFQLLFKQSRYLFMKYLPLLLIFNIFFSFSQEAEKNIQSKKNTLSIGFETQHVLRGSTDQHYRLAYYGYDITESFDKSFTQQYNVQLQYSQKYGFARLTAGYLLDYVNLQQMISSQ